MNKKGKFAKFLDLAFIDYQKRLGESKQQNEFAAWLEVDPVVLNRHINGTRVPKKDDPVIQKYVDKLGPGVYDALDLARPDEDLKRFLIKYDAIPKENQKEALKGATEFLIERGATRDKSG